jgi:hypothetical protein
MIRRRRRFKQTVPFKDRLAAKDIREQAANLPTGPDKNDLLNRARRADGASHLDEWARSAGLQPPT